MSWIQFNSLVIRRVTTTYTTIHRAHGNQPALSFTVCDNKVLQFLHFYTILFATIHSTAAAPFVNSVGAIYQPNFHYTTQIDHRFSHTLFSKHLPHLNLSLFLWHGLGAGAIIALLLLLLRVVLVIHSNNISSLKYQSTWIRKSFPVDFNCSTSDLLLLLLRNSVQFRGNKCVHNERTGKHKQYISNC